MSNQKLISFFSLWIANSLVFLVASLILTGNVVLGNDKVSMPMAAVIAGFVLTTLMLVVEPVVKKSGYKVTNQNIWGLIYLVYNVAALWLLKKFALVLGLGISSLVWVVVIAVVLTLVQWGVVMATGSMKKGK